MKYTLFLSALVFCFLSCMSDASQKAPIVLSGNVENAKAEIVSLSWDTMEYDLSLNEEGKFNDTLDLEEGYYTFTHGRERTEIYLKPGDVLNVSLDSKNFDESIKWEGEGANENNYLAQKALLEESIKGSYKDLYSLDELGFVEEIASRESKMDSLLEATTDLTESFKSVEANNIKYKFMSDAYDYEGAHRYFTGDSEFCCFR